VNDFSVEPTYNCNVSSGESCGLVLRLPVHTRGVRPTNHSWILSAHTNAHTFVGRHIFRHLAIRPAMSAGDEALPCCCAPSDVRFERAFDRSSEGTYQAPETQLKLWRRVHDLAGNDPDAVKKIADREIKKREAEFRDLWEILVPVANNESLKSTTGASAGFCVDSQATMERPHGLPATVTGRTARASVAAKR
jgi:hypothetical protein